MEYPWYRRIGKRWLDLSLTILVLLLSWPVFAVLAILIKSSSNGPIIFRQKRIGTLGKPFTIYKFRTMKDGAEKQQKKLKHLNEADGPVFKIHHDPRFTRLGKWLAHTGLDELPQLVNVLKGDMSFVGPRPLPVKEAKKIPAKWREQREHVPPGIVSSWVIRGTHSLSFHQWMELDLKDLENSLGQDMRIILASAHLILGQCKQKIRQLLSL